MAADNIAVSVVDACGENIVRAGSGVRSTP